MRKHYVRFIKWEHNKNSKSVTIRGRYRGHLFSAYHKLTEKYIHVLFDCAILEPSKSYLERVIKYAIRRKLNKLGKRPKTEAERVKRTGRY